MRTPSDFREFNSTAAVLSFAQIKASASGWGGSQSLGVQSVGAVSASLTGLTGGTAAVTVYWGDTDGGTTPGNWAHSLSLGVLGEGAFSTNLSGLTLDTTCYYTCYASNGVGTAWAPSSTNFHTLAMDTIRIEAEDYDQGGEGVAYHDTDPVNQGGAYRLGVASG